MGILWVDLVEMKTVMGYLSKTNRTMKIKQKLKLILCIFILASCAEKEEVPTLQKGIAIITGKVINLGEDSKAIRFVAGGIVEGIEQTAIIDSEGNFRLEIELYYPQNVQSFFKKGYIKLYLSPSDSIHLEIDEDVFRKEAHPDYKVSGTNPSAKISKEIQQYLQYCGENSFNPDAQGKSVNTFLQVLNQEIIRRDSILQRFSKEYNTSKEFEDWAKNDIKYGIANYLIDYRYTNQGYKGNLFDESLFPINNDAAIVTDLYPLHLYHYALNLGIWQDSTTQKLMQEGKNVEAFQRCFDKIINSVGSGLSRDIMCYKLLSSIISEFYDDYEIVSQETDTYIENEILKSVLAEKESEYKNNKVLNVSFFDTQTNEEKEILGDFWQELNEKYSGKIVYVDIWATWCGPCRIEIPYAKELHEYFKEKDIEFVNICLASNKSEWEKMLESSNITGDNYFFNEPQTQLLRNKLQFEGYPTYLIVDKQGDLVDKNAPRPSSGEEIKKILNEWIEKDTP